MHGQQNIKFCKTQIIFVCFNMNRYSAEELIESSKILRRICSLIVTGVSKGIRPYSGSSPLTVLGMLEALRSFEKSGTLYQSIRRNIAEDLSF